MDNHEHQEWNTVFSHPPAAFHQKVVSTLAQLPQEKKENEVMKNNQTNRTFSIKKIAIASIAAVMLLGTTAFAASQITSLISVSSANSDYTALPSQETMAADLGFEAKLVEQFANGFQFDSAHIVYSQGLDDAGNSLVNFKELNLIYQNGGEDILLSTTDYILENTVYDATHQYQGITLYETNSKIKFVPENYELTEQEKQDERDGLYSISEGSSQVEFHEYLHLQWVQDGIFYSFMATDSDMSSDEVLAMAYELIDMV